MSDDRWSGMGVMLYGVPPMPGTERDYYFKPILPVLPVQPRAREAADG